MPMTVYKVVRVLPSGHRVSAYASGAWAHVYPPLGTVEARKGKLFVFRRRLDAEGWLHTGPRRWLGRYEVLRARSLEIPTRGEMAARSQPDFARHWSGKLDRYKQVGLPTGTLLVSSLQLLE